MPPAKPALRFTYVLVRNWRNFPKADADLGPRVMLAGPSGAGKTNFLDIFRFLADLASPSCGFQQGVERRGGVRRLRCLAGRHDSAPCLAVRAGDAGNPALWEYELSFNQEGGGPPMVRRERFSRAGEDIVTRPDEADKNDPGLLAQTCLEKGGSPGPIRDFAAFLKAVRYENPLAALLREPDPLPGERLEPFGGGFLHRVLATPERFRVARLRNVLETLQDAVPQFSQLEAFRDERGRPHLRALQEHWRPRGAWQEQNHLADGTLRLIALLWSALDGSGPLLIEEPETSLHPQAIRLVPRMLAGIVRKSGRQLILTTRSLDLLCGEGVETGEIRLLNPVEGQTVVRPALDLAEAAELLDRGTLHTESDAAALEAAARERQLGLF